MILTILAIGWIARALGSPGMDRQGLGSDGLDRWAPCRKIVEEVDCVTEERNNLQEALGAEMQKTLELNNTKKELLQALNVESSNWRRRIERRKLG